MDFQKLYKQFIHWIASTEIETAVKNAVQERLNALASVFPEFAKKLGERQAASAEAKVAAEAQKAVLLQKVADLDAEIQKHEDFEAAVQLLTSK